MIDNKEVTKKLVIQKVLWYINSEEWRKEIIKDNKYARKFLWPVSMEGLHESELNERLAMIVGILRKNSSEVVRYEELGMDLYWYYMSQCMSYIWSEEFVYKIMGKFINMILNDILSNSDNYYNVDELKDTEILKLLRGDNNNFIWCMIWADINKDRDGINNLWDNTKHWLELNGKVKREDGTVINNVKDFTTSQNDDLVYIYNEIIKWTGGKYNNQKNIINNMLTDEGKELTTAMFRRHLYMLCIKSILFYKTHYNGDATVNYDFYWKHKDKIDKLKNMWNWDRDEKEKEDVTIAKDSIVALKDDKWVNDTDMASLSEGDLWDIDMDPWF